MCGRLTDIYGEPSQVISVEPEEGRRGFYLVRISTCWEGKSLLRTLRLSVHRTKDEIDVSELLEP